jgi:hypothetical protein
MMMEIRLLEETVSKLKGPKEFHGRRVGQIVDVGLLKSWIHTCKKKHRENCEKEWWRDTPVGEVRPSSMRVVDVARMAIVPAPPSCRYAALSYVWGGTGERYWTTQANLKQRNMPGSLDTSTLPNTISDTIQLVRQLGERYLWIDALCIVQDDPNDKAVQIRVMDLIYNNSAFTIFAVGCTSVQDPLPGVRPGTRDPKQQVAKIQGLHLAAPLRSPTSAITSSTWNERGWTYQEAMLSQRRIFFTAHQVYFECKQDTWSEDIVAEPTDVVWDVRPHRSRGVGQITPASAPINDWMRNLYLGPYMRVIEEYTQRRLTVESDIVDAVTALLKVLTDAYHLANGNFDEAFKFGMPLGDLQQVLLWQPAANAPHSRRVPVDEMMVPWPSWSWAAWRGAARYASVSVFIDIQARGAGVALASISQSLVEQWYVVDIDGQPVRQYLNRQPRLSGTNKDIPSTMYIAPKGDINPQQLIIEHAPLLPGTLVFRTSYSHFDVTKANDIAGAGTGVVANYAIYSILSDIPRPSTLVGRVILPCSTHSPTLYEFVVLCRGQEENGLYDEERLGKQYSGCMLYVMAVQKMQDEQRMERVGVGVIFEQAWLNSMAEEKIVYLG